jgi:hypothetical protein
MMIPLLLLATPAVPSANSAAAQKDPPVRVWFSDDGKYVYGDRARVYVRPAEDGYVLVLRADDRGNVRVLSPVDPDDDQQAHGGKKYEVKDRGGREAFVVEDTSGQGTVLAAWSKTPFDLRRYERNGHWDLEALGQAGGRTASAADPESRLVGIVDAMRPDRGRYEYHASTYVVYSPRYARAVYPYPYPWAAWNGGWWGYEPWWGRPFYGARVVFAPRPFGFRRFR